MKARWRKLLLGDACNIPACFILIREMALHSLAAADFSLPFARWRTLTRGNRSQITQIGGTDWASFRKKY